MVGSGQERLGRLGFGWVGLGRVIAADGSTEDYGPLCCSLGEWSWPGKLWWGTVKYGQVMLGVAGLAGRFGALST